VVVRKDPKVVVRIAKTLKSDGVWAFGRPWRLGMVTPHSLYFDVASIHGILLDSLYEGKHEQFFLFLFCVDLYALILSTVGNLGTDF